jgi:hypothetical protein
MLEQGYLLGLVTGNVEAAAHAAGIPCVGVASHHYNAEELKAGGADWVIDSLTDGLPLRSPPPPTRSGGLPALGVGGGLGRWLRLGPHPVSDIGGVVACLAGVGAVA